MSLRPATEADRAEMLALWDEAFPGEHDYAVSFIDNWLGKTFVGVMERVDGASPGAAKRSEDGSPRPEAERHLDAMAFGFDVESETGTYRYLYALAVRKTMRGKGLGRAFLADYERQTRSAGYAGVLAVVMPEGPWGFYEKLGYAAVLRRASGIYGVLKRFDGTIPDPVPRIENTME